MPCRLALQGADGTPKPAPPKEAEDKEEDKWKAFQGKGRSLK
jgi:hypothetical protein